MSVYREALLNIVHSIALNTIDPDRFSVKVTITKAILSIHVSDKTSRQACTKSLRAHEIKDGVVPDGLVRAKVMEAMRGLGSRDGFFKNHDGGFSVDTSNDMEAA